MVSNYNHLKLIHEYYSIEMYNYLFHVKILVKYSFHHHVLTICLICEIRKTFRMSI
jgi:hypothetical protein